MQNSDEKIKIEDFGTKFTEISLSSFIAAFIEGVSAATIDKIVSEGYDTLDKIKKAEIKNLCRDVELKENVALIIMYGVIEHENEMDEFIKSGKIKIIQPTADKGNLNEFSFCFTWPLEIMSRNEAKEKIRMLGGIAVSSATRNLSFLVTNDTDSNSSKNEYAKEYNISIINENEFYDIIKNPEKASYYKKRGYTRIDIADNAMSARITIEDIVTPRPDDRLEENHVSNKGILPKYKDKGMDLKSIRYEQYGLANIQKNIKENQIDCLHYCYMDIAKLYYKHHEVDAEILSASLKYYLLDLELLQKYRDFMVDQCEKTFREYVSNLGANFLDKKIEEIKNDPTRGADDTFKQLIIIYVKQGLYENALEICDKAIEFSENNIYYNKKKDAIIKKIAQGRIMNTNK
jgi:hypothetical protein